MAKPPRTRGEVLVFRRGKDSLKPRRKDISDAESQLQRRPVVAEKVDATIGFGRIAAGAAAFHWEDLCYDINIKGEERRLLDHVDGWVKPGTSTALMVSPNLQFKPGVRLAELSSRVFPAPGKPLC